MDGLIEASFAFLPWKFRRKLDLKKDNGKTVHISSSNCRAIDIDIRHCLLLLILFSLGNVNGKGHFPEIKDLSSFGDVKTSSSCGLNNKQMSYCISNIKNESILQCTQKTCLLNCCEKCGVSSPTFIFLDKAQRSSGVYISADKHPYSSKLDSNSLNFQTNGFIFDNTFSGSSNFTFATWIKQETQNVG